MQTLLKDSRIDEAKSHLLKRLQSSIENGDKPVQMTHYSKLIEFALHSVNDVAAAEYIERLVLLEDTTAGFCGQEDRRRSMVRYSRYALCLFRLRRFDAAGPLLPKAFCNPDHVMRAMTASGHRNLYEHLESKLMASLDVVP